MVKNQKIQFQNGTYINCELKTIEKVNTETGEVKTHREVTNVVECGDEENGFKPIPHKRRVKNNDNSKQLSLFGDEFNIPTV